MTLESVKMYNTLIDICAKTGALSVAESLYKEMMRDEDAPRSLYSVTSLIEAQSRGGRSIEEIQRSLAAYYGDHNDPVSKFVQNGGAPAAVLIDSLGFCDAPARMVDTVFEAIPSDMRNANHHLSLIEAHARSGRVDAALDAIRGMEASGISRRVRRKASAYAIARSLLPRSEKVEQKLREVAEELGDSWWVE